MDVSSQVYAPEPVWARWQRKKSLPCLCQETNTSHPAQSL